MSISIFGLVVGALLWGIVLSLWVITRRVNDSKQLTQARSNDVDRRVLGFDRRHY